MKTVIEMAKEAGALESIGDHTFDATSLERFAALVREDEREACAKVCDEVAKHYITNHKEQEQVWLLAATSDCAAAIRARGETK